MSLNSFLFLVFFAGVFVVFWKFPKRYRWVWLLLAGYYFYSSWKPAYLGLILLTTIVNFYGAIAMHRAAKHKKRYLLLALLFDISALFIFKYFNFFSLTLDQVWGISLPQFTLLVPIGISFYTLQVTGYLLDVYRGKLKPERHFGFFSLFVCFFPQLSAGPIERGNTLLPQLKKLPAYDYNRTATGMKLFAIGLFKKMVIADNLGLVVDRVFGSLPEFRGISLVITVFFYSWQIYMDFSGYTDMARGIAAMVGIDLMENFRLPYLATSVGDFWRRWHISLSSWLRDYIYIPLGGSRKGLVKTIRNTLIVFTMSGLWHGAAWNFVIWGFLHGAWISFEKIGRRILPQDLYIPRVVKITYSYLLISVFWIFFRAETLSDALYIVRYAFVGAKNFLSPNYLWASLSHLFVFNTVEVTITFGLLLVAIVSEIVRSRVSFSQLLNKQPILLRFAMYALLVFMIIQLRNAVIKEFIYVRF